MAGGEDGGAAIPVPSLVGELDSQVPQLRPGAAKCNERDFEHYVNGYGKGWNDFRGHLTGEYNNYTPESYKE